MTATAPPTDTPPADAPLTIVTLPPPTPNGGLHVGHMAGPFLAADIYVKALKRQGLPVHVLSYSDTNQSYVRVTAEKQGADPAALASRWTRDILETLALYGCTVDDYFEPDAASNGFVRALFLGLYEQGIVRKKAFPFFWSPSRGGFLDEAGVSGFCPVCLDNCKCGICEGCGTVTAADTLIGAYDTNAPDRPIEIRPVEVMVLELEAFRDRIARFHADNPRLRPKYRWLVEDALAAPLPDFPITVPGDWGIAVDHPEFPGQVINAWPEIMADFVWGYERAPRPKAPPPRVVNFFGYDNSYFYAIVHVALLHALGLERYLPHATVINEFYNLDHAKFSTSRGHVIWAREIAGETPPDLVRFFTALTAPGFEQGNFNAAEMHAVLRDRLATPWQDVADGIAALAGEAGGTVGDVGPEARRTAAALTARVRHDLGLERFHLRHACEDCLHGLGLLRHRLARPDPDRNAAGRMADARHLLAAWADAIAPLCPGLAEAIERWLAGPPWARLERDLFALLQPEHADA